MLELLHVHFSFFCRKGRTNIKGQSPIVLRIIYRQERRDIFTGLYCNHQHWDNSTGKVRSCNKLAVTINKNIELINYQAMQVFDQLKFSRTPFTIDELVSKIKGKEERPVLLVEYLSARITEFGKKKGFDISRPTYEKYERSGRFVMNFLETQFNVKNYALVKIDSLFLKEYFQYLRTIRGIGNNTAVKYMAFFKTLLMPAIQTGVIRHDPYKNVKFRFKTIPKGFLTDEEIGLLVNLTFGSPDLERIRDQFLFCCYTGLAYSDLRQLRREHLILQGNSDYYILKPRQKTGQDCIIPLLPAAKQILQKYSPCPDFRDFRWHVSANQKMNQRLKSIGDIANLSKPLHMHLARHTFATTITLSKGVPIETVSSMLGHASIRQTQHYAKIVALKVVNDMAKIKLLYQ